MTKVRALTIETSTQEQYSYLNFFSRHGLNLIYLPIYNVQKYTCSQSKCNFSVSVCELETSSHLPTMIIGSDFRYLGEVKPIWKKQGCDESTHLITIDLIFCTVSFSHTQTTPIAPNQLALLFISTPRER